MKQLASVVLAPAALAQGPALAHCSFSAGGSFQGIEKLWADELFAYALQNMKFVNLMNGIKRS